MFKISISEWLPNLWTNKYPLATFTFTNKLINISLMSRWKTITELKSTKSTLNFPGTECCSVTAILFFNNVAELLGDLTNSINNIV